MKTETAVRWEQMYNDTPLRDVPAHFQGLCAAPFLQRYLDAVLRLCPPGSRTLETGVGTGYGAIWLSQREVAAEGLDYAPRIVERAKQTNNILGGRATFRCGDLFTLYGDMPARSPTLASAPPYRVIHHQGVLEHCTVPQIRAALAQQVALAEWVIFSVPSVHYPFEPEFGDERMLPIEEWRRILAPFVLEELRYYGDPRFGGKEHVLAVLRGQPIDDALLARMTVPAEPYPQGITVIIHSRNEATNIADCLASVKGCADEIIVCDMESTDETLAIVRRVAPNAIILPHPHLDNFDRARNVSAMRAGYRWIAYLDADERIPEGMGPLLRRLLTVENPAFSALQLPFKHHFAGRWLRCLSPGYKAPSVFKNGCFTYHARTHAGAQVEGPVARLPFDHPDHALPHYAFADIGQYLQKLDRYTVAEAASMHTDGRPFHWREAVRHTVHDLCAYYDAAGAGELDGVHGLLYSVLSGFYRWVQHARLYESRYHAGQLHPSEQEVPGSVEEMLQFALEIAREERQRREGAQSVTEAASPIGTAEESNSLVAEEGAQVADMEPVVADVVWCGPFGSASGYGEESRHFPFGLEEAGIKVAARSNGWREEAEALTPVEAARLRTLTKRSIAPNAVWIVQDFAPRFARPEGAGLVIGRTMFETDRIPADWALACNRMDAIWVPSEFHRQTFLRSGVEAHRLAVIPGCFDPTPFLNTRPPAESVRAKRNLPKKETRPFTFLSVFDWTLHKGWDVLLTGFLQAFEGRDDVALTLKVWSSLGYSEEQIREQAAEHVRRTLGHDLLADPRIRFVFDRLTLPDLIALYHAADAFVLPSRGEGWGRPFMEAMACGLPTIGTNWSGNTAFMTADNSLLIDCAVVDVPEEGWREVPVYKGHRWAESSLPSLVAHLRRVVEQPEEAREIGRRAQEHVVTHFNRTEVGKQIAAEIDRLRASKVLLPAISSPALSLRWEGPFLSRHSLALVNRQICRGLLAEGGVEMSLVPMDRPEMGPEEEPGLTALVERSFAPLEGTAAVHVRHQFPPRFERPEEGSLVLIQPWEYGFLPKEWIAPILANVAEVWCYSRYVQEVYLASGIPKEKLRIVPLGVDTEIFCPEAPPYVFTTEPGAERRNRSEGKPFTFLFVGGTLHRKGIDILLDAYLRAFSACDNVCLVIKDTGTQTVYRGQNERERILALAADPNRPAIIYIEEELSPHRLAGLYTACDCLIQPYRGEGFCLPALEAMACGIPAVVPEGGPTNDFVDETVGWRLPAERLPMPENHIGPWECVETPWMWEVSPDVLAQRLRQLVRDPEEVKRRGAAAVERVRASWSWQHTTQAVLARLEALAGSAPALALPETEQPHSSMHVTDLLLSRRPRISLCMIVRDEERVLGPCLQSARPWVEEIIVIDTGSTDRTIEIALSHGARVEHFVWCDDFSAARNESLKYATGDWILWLDGDDTLPWRSGEAIRQFVETAPAQISAFVIPVQFVEDGSTHGATRVDHVKLFRNGLGVQFERRIHEQILASLRQVGGEIARCPALVLHSGYDVSPEGQKKKRVRDARILELELQERPDDPFTLFNLGMTEHYGGEHVGAVGWLRRCLEVSAPTDSIVRKAYAMLALSQRELGEADAALETVEAGLHVTPNDPELHFHRGRMLADRGRYQEAKAAYEAVVSCPLDDHFSSVDMSILGYKTFHNLGGLCRMLRDYPGAQHWWSKAVADAPQFLPSALALFDAALEVGDFATAERMLHVVRAADPTGTDAPLLHARLAAAQGDRAGAEYALQETVTAAPESVQARLALVRCLLAEERLAEAETHLHALEQADVAEAAYCLGVMAIRKSDLPTALRWMERAARLNPAHAETQVQIAQLKQALVDS
ncbi:MAG: hypothetical protein JWL77_2547 [Chthonomonadaceae bacterium]|nr:hypothetical protein [Chthonomonadaceae bacterium]